MDRNGNAGHGLISGYQAIPPPYPGTSQELGNPLQQNSHSYSDQNNYVFSVQSNSIMTTVCRNSEDYSAPPQDYTTLSWLACLCCFWPTGLMAIMKASESRDALARGHMAEAHVAAYSARHLIKISFLVGLLEIVVVVAVLLFADLDTSIFKD